MINLVDLRDHIVIPTLKELELYSESAVRLVIGTGLTESNFEYVHQIGGPALGFYQMEPNTYKDIWDNFLLYRPHIARRMNGFNLGYTDAEQLVWNIKLATAMCRVHYLRDPNPLPDKNDILAMANTWKIVYNTERGGGTVEDFLNKASIILEL